MVKQVVPILMGGLFLAALAAAPAQAGSGTYEAGSVKVG